MVQQCLKKHHAVQSNLHIDMITFIRHFSLIVPIPAFCFCPIPIFLEFYLSISNLLRLDSALIIAKHTGFSSKTLVN